LGKPIVHFEIPASDTERMSRFYSDLFDWKFDRQSMPGMEYWMIETTGRGPEHLGGGMYAKQGDSDRPRFYIGVEDIDSHTDRFRQAGGTVIVEKQEVPGFGWSVLGTDPEGNVVGLFQASQPMPQPTRARSSSRRSKASGKGKKKTAKSKKRKK
jgi:predicted enzyme related to lactoylglutathione lyase